jgi:hypothetical protein
LKRNFIEEREEPIIIQNKKFGSISK